MDNILLWFKQLKKYIKLIIRINVYNKEKHERKQHARLSTYCNQRLVCCIVVATVCNFRLFP